MDFRFLAISSASLLPTDTFYHPVAPPNPNGFSSMATQAIPMGVRVQLLTLLSVEHKMSMP